MLLYTVILCFIILEIYIYKWNAALTVHYSWVLIISSCLTLIVVQNRLPAQPESRVDSRRCRILPECHPVPNQTSAAGQLHHHICIQNIIRVKNQGRTERNGNVALFYNPDKKSRLLSRQRLAEDLYHPPLSDNRKQYSCLVQSMNALYSLTGKIYFYTEADTDEAGVVEMSAQSVSGIAMVCGALQ